MLGREGGSAGYPPVVPVTSVPLGHVQGPQEFCVLIHKWRWLHKPLHPPTPRPRPFLSLPLGFWKESWLQGGPGPVWPSVQLVLQGQVPRPAPGAAPA